MRQKKQARMFTLVQEWEGSQQTKQTFCKTHQINPTTFHYWIQKYNKYNLPAPAPALISDYATTENNPFVTLSINKTKGSPSHLEKSLRQGIELNYPNGVHLRLNGPVDITYLSSLIKLSL